MASPTGYKSHSESIRIIVSPPGAFSDENKSRSNVEKSALEELRFMRTVLEAPAKFPLHYAILNNDIDRVTLLMESIGLGINQRDEVYRLTPLEMTIGFPIIKIDQALILLQNPKLDVNASDEGRAFHPLIRFFSVFSGRAENIEEKLRRIQVLERMIAHSSFNFSQEDFRQLLEAIDPSCENLQPKEKVLAAFIESDTIFNFFLSQFEEHIENGPSELQETIKNFVSLFIADFKLYMTVSSVKAEGDYEVEVEEIKSLAQKFPDRFERMRRFLESMEFPKIQTAIDTLSMLSPST